jgi:hypothetical protein
LHLQAVERGRDDDLAGKPGHPARLQMDRLDHPQVAAHHMAGLDMERWYQRQEFLHGDTHFHAVGPFLVVIAGPPPRWRIRKHLVHSYKAL